MNQILFSKIQKSSAHTQNRIENGNFVVENPDLVQDLVVFCFESDNKFHIRACCILEKVFEIDLDLSYPYLDFIAHNIHKIKNDSAIRSLSRFIKFLAQKNSQKNTNNQPILSAFQHEKFTEAAFDWLISDYRIAVKANAIYMLFELGKNTDWIYPELKMILEQTTNPSPGYKVVVRNVLEKLHKN